MAGDHAGLDLGELAPNEPSELGRDDDSGFEVVRRGYDQRQVDSHLGRMDAEIRILIADRNAAVEQASQLGRELDESRARAERLRAQVRTLVSPVQSVPGMSERMRSMLRMAEDEVNDMLSRAETEAARRWHDADQEAAEIRSAALTDAERSAAQDAKRRAECEAQCVAATQAMAAEQRQAAAAVAAERAAAEARIAADEEAARQDRARECADWEARQAQVEDDFAIAMDQRRAQALHELETGRTESYRRNADMLTVAKEHSERTIAEADEYARRTIAAAQLRVTELTTARERVAEQVGRARAVLDQVLGTLSNSPEHAAITAPKNGAVRPSPTPR